MDDLKHEEIKTSKRRKWWKPILLVALVLVLIPLLLSFLLQFKSVQNWATNQATTYLSRDVDGEVSIGDVELSFFEGLKLKDFVLVDKQDTILHAKSMNLGLRSSLLSLYYNELDFSTLHLKSPKIKIIKEKGSTETGMALLLQKLLGTPETSGEGQAPRINLERLILEDGILLLADQNNKLTQEITVDKVLVAIKSYSEKLIDISRVRLVNPRFSLRKDVGEVLELDSVSTAKMDSVQELQQIRVAQVEIENGYFAYRDMESKEKSPVGSFDVRDIGVSDIDLTASNLTWDGAKSVYAHIKSVSLKEKNGFEIKELACPDVHISDSNISLPSFRMRTGHSVLNRTLSMEYSSYGDFMDFVDRVHITSTMRSARIGVRDLLYFAPELREIAYFSDENQSIELDGYIHGTINKLSAERLTIQSDDILLKGDLRTENLTVRDEEYLDFQIDTLVTDIATLEKAIPRFQPIENLYTLGSIRYSGRFSGMIQDFTANGNIQTDIGNGNLNLHFDTSEDIPSYDGYISVKDFDLKKWSGDERLGFASFKGEILKGKGLKLSDIYADVNAQISYLDFKGYRHENFNLDGSFSNNSFHGKADILNADAAMDITGTFDLNDDIPTYKFSTDVSKLNLEKLGLSKQIHRVEGRLTMDGVGNSLDSLVGSIHATGLQISTKNRTFYIDSISIESSLEGDIRDVRLQSDVAQAYIQGAFDFRSIIPAVEAMVKTNYPSYWDSTVVVPAITNHQEFTFSADVKNTKNYLSLISKDSLIGHNIHIEGKVDTETNTIDVLGRMDSIVGGVAVDNVLFSVASKDSEGKVILSLDSLDAQGVNLPYTKVDGSIGDGTYAMQLLSESFLHANNYMDVTISGQKQDDGFDFHILQDSLHLMSSDWVFAPDNHTHISKNSFNISKLSLSDGNRVIRLSDIANKGVAFSMKNFDFKSIDRAYIQDKYIHLTGPGELEVFVNDLYVDSPVLIGRAEMPSFYVNDDDFGHVTLNFSKGQKDIVDVNFNLAKGDTSLVLLGEYDIDAEEVKARVKSSLIPMRLFQHILVSGIHDTRGGLDVEGTVSGHISDIHIEGTGLIHNGSTTVDYTGVTYTFDQERFKFDEHFIDLTGGKIYDEDGDFGVITGGLYHDLFNKFGLRANITSDNILGLNTTKEDNPIYYGRGKGYVSVDFNGPFNSVNMRLNCETKKGSTLNIPIQSTTGNVDNNFITFVKKESLYTTQKEEETKVKLDPLDIEISLTMTPDAIVNLIFDENYGDVIKGQGRGDMKMYFTRYGDFSIYGDYDIEVGEYLFTALGFIAKSFDVRKGSRIRWTGDPINASLDIVADYRVRAPLDIFLAEYLTQINSEESRNKTEIDLQLLLGNTLYNPSVNFDLSFPNVTGDLRSLVESKLYTLKDNQNELNNQVMGLIVFNSFLSSTSFSNVAGQDYQAAGISTISEFVSSQLSLLFTGLLNEALSENGLISGIDFDIGLRKNSFLGINTNNSFLPDEIEVHLKNRFRFWDERLSLNVGGNYVRAPLRNIQEYVIGDFILEYFLTNDRKLKLRMYGKYDYDEAATDRRLRYGLGIGYRTEFGSMLSLRDRLVEDIKGDIQSAENN